MTSTHLQGSSKVCTLPYLPGQTRLGASQQSTFGTLCIRQSLLASALLLLEPLPDMRCMQARGWQSVSGRSLKELWPCHFQDGVLCRLLQCLRLCVWLLHMLYHLHGRSSLQQHVKFVKQ